MLLTPDQIMIRDAVRDFAQQELWPHAAQWDKEHTFPHEVHKGLAALGAYGICVPEELGGAGLNYLTLALVLEEIAAGDGGTSRVAKKLGSVDPTIGFGAIGLTEAHRNHRSHCGERRGNAQTNHKPRKGNPDQVGWISENHQEADHGD